MAYVVEIIGRPGVYLVMSNTDQQFGVINGSDDEWYWQIFGFDVVHETSLARAKAAALNEAKILEDKSDRGLSRIADGEVFAPGLSLVHSRLRR